MAVRKGTKSKAPVKTASNRGRKKKTSSGKKTIPWAVLFWLAFVILMLGLYIANREVINRSFLIVKEALFPGTRDGAPIAESPTGPDVIQVPPPTPVAQPSSAPPPVETPPPEAATSQPEMSSAPLPVETPPPEVIPSQPPATALRDRALYFIRVGSDGSVLGVMSDRGLPASDSPLRDAIQALIAGPNAEETQGGLISLIPVGTRLLSVTIRGDTAYINFNEDFQYNTYGTQGYNGQLRQVVFTATEFASVSDVQILIEGNRVDFLGEKVWIGSPLSRWMFQ